MSRHDASTDSGTVLKKDSWAMIWDDECQHFHLLMPDGPSDEELPEQAVLLTAFWLRSEQDEEFRTELIEWFKALKPA